MFFMCKYLYSFWHTVYMLFNFFSVYQEVELSTIFIIYTNSWCKMIHSFQSNLLSWYPPAAVWVTWCLRDTLCRDSFPNHPGTSMGLCSPSVSPAADGESMPRLESPPAYPEPSAVPHRPCRCGAHLCHPQRVSPAPPAIGPPFICISINR